ncbi:MAG: PAS domain S-box protein [Chlamydiota bacterium]
MAKYRAIVAQAVEGTIVLQGDPMRIVFANRAAARMSGMSIRKLTQLTPVEIAARIHPDDRGRVLSSLKKRLAGEKVPLRSACRLIRADGRVQDIEMSSRRIRFDGRRAVQVAFIDSTEERGNREKLRLLSAAVEQSSEGIAVSDVAGRLLYLNRAFAAMHGYTVQSLVGKYLSVFHTPAQMAVVRAALARTHAGGHFSGEVAHVRRDGTCFPSLMQTTLLRDAKRRLIGIVGTCRDITDIKKATSELARSKEEKTRILDSVEEAITYKDRQMRIVWANWAAARRVGMKPRELLGRRCHELLHGLRRPCAKCPCLLAMRTGEPSWGESVAAGGRSYLIGAYPVRDGEGRITGSVDVAIEAGDRNRADEIHNLRSFSKMLIGLQEEERRRIALELHDQVGQSLTATKLYLQRIEREFGRTGHPAMREFADAISLIDAAVNDVRTISHRLRPPILDILGLVPSLAQLVKSLAGKSGVEITFAARGIRGKIDARIEIALYRVVQEALSNALKYSGCRRIDIALRGSGGALALRVTDDGKGFAPLRANRMTGLGLTGMRERIEGVGGTFAVKSGPGEGTKIEATVPAPAGIRRTRQRGMRS